MKLRRARLADDCNSWSRVLALEFGESFEFEAPIVGLVVNEVRIVRIRPNFINNGRLFLASHIHTFLDLLRQLVVALSAVYTFHRVVSRAVSESWRLFCILLLQIGIHHLQERA